MTRRARQPIASSHDAPNPWEQQDHEDPRQFHAFCHYRDLAPWRRGLRVAAETHRIDCLKKPSGDPARMVRGKGTNQIPIFNSWVAWSSKFGWPSRAKAWDREQERERLVEQQREREEMLERHAVIAKAMLARVAARILSIDVDALSSQTLVRWFSAAVTVERLARGVPTELVAAVHEQADDDGPDDLLDYPASVRAAHNALLAALAAAEGNTP